MKVVFFTIALDAMPWITHHYPVFRKLKIPWEWWVMEGVAAPEKCTSWCKQLAPRLSKDGTSEYLQSLAWDERVHINQRVQWRGKVEMVNFPLKFLWEPCLLWEVDSDELWTAPQIERLAKFFEEHPEYDRAEFFCRYYLGPDIVITSRDTYGNRTDFEWRRVWRFRPGSKFTTHEPPTFTPINGSILKHKETEGMGLVFEHFAYATPQQIAFKSEYYPYPRIVEQWERLQANQKWPARVGDYLEWVKDEAIAERIKL